MLPLLSLFRRLRLLLLFCLLAPHFSSLRAEAELSRERSLLDSDWHFALGHATDPAKDFGHATRYFSYLAKTGFGDGPASAAFDDRGWRRVNLPHDWAVEAPFDPHASPSHGYKAIGRGFPERSVGWYRHTFTVPASDLGRRIQLEFDGVFRAARVFVNGFYVGEQPSGYLDAHYDITDYLKYGEDNVVAVRVDVTMEEGWFYEGAGIYRHVWLTKLNPVHVARHGTWVRTEVNDNQAVVQVETTVMNDGEKEETYELEQTILGPDGKPLTRTESAPTATIAAGISVLRQDRFVVPSPQLWSLESPAMHRLVTIIRQKGREIDRYETPFGIRTIRFDPNAGFFLNGQHVVLKGTNNHQDHAGVGIAVPDALQEFRIKRLKEMGSNAYRCSHHPPTPELLDACDRLGMLVIDENRLMGANPHHLGQLEQMIRRDRNHPSVILWSVGNEEWAIEGKITGARLAATMQRAVNRLDPTRLASAAISGGWGGISKTIAAPGVNYVKQGDPDKQHADYPWQVIIGTEETTTQGTRGVYVDDLPRAHWSPQTNGTSGGNAESGWRYYAARPYTAGVFFWTGFDYRGEATPFGYPGIGSQFGILDTCGFPKDGFYYLKSWWGQEDVLHIFPHWNWPDRLGQTIEVTVNSNCDEVELWLNGASQGRKKMERNGHLTWPVKYTPGVLLARGYRGGREVLMAKIETAEKPAAIVLQPDRSELRADGRDVSVVAVELRDDASRFVPTGAAEIEFQIQGPGRIIGVGNGDPSGLEPDQFVETVRAERIGTWRAPDPSIPTGSITFEATFDRPVLAQGETVSLLLNALGSNQSAYLNGEPLYRNASLKEAKAERAIDLNKLKVTGNTLRLEATRFTEWSMREDIMQFHPASWRITTLAKPWRRTTFNGLAQVIVQSTGQPGAIILQATGAALKPQRLSLTAK